MNDLDEGPIGQYRKTDRGIPGVNHPEWKEVPRQLDNLLIWYQEKKESNLHPIELVSRFHCRFEEIHPFHEGNGRTGRAILDFMLRSDGFATIFIPIKQKHDYITALRAANTTPRRDSNYGPIIEFIINRMTQTLIHVFIKTGLAQAFKSLEFKEFALRLVPQEIYDPVIIIPGSSSASNTDNFTICSTVPDFAASETKLDVNSTMIREYFL